MFFARTLRAAGLPIGPGRVIDALRAIEAVGIGTREIHDALKRRCFYYWVDYPSAERELEILKVKAPEVGAALAREVVAFVQKLRKQDLFKLPGVAETIDWAEALIQLDKVALDPQGIDDTLGVLLKYQDDIAKIKGSEAAHLLQQVKAELAATPR